MEGGGRREESGGRSRIAERLVWESEREVKESGARWSAVDDVVFFCSWERAHNGKQKCTEN